MKKFCPGDIVPAWSPVSDALPCSALQEALASCLARNSNLTQGTAVHEDERRFNLQEANAA